MKLLLVIDYQKDFVDGSLGFKGAETLENGIYNLVKEYQKNKDQVLFTFDTHSENYLKTSEGKYLPVEHCLKGTPGWDLYGKLKEFQADAMKIEKPTFGSLELIDYLKKNSFTEIMLVGLVSNICILANAVICKTAQPETKVIVDASLTKSFDEDLNTKTFDVLKGLQVEVINNG